MTVRRAGPGDGPAIEALLAACGLAAHDVLAPGTRYWLAEQGGAVVGTVGLEDGPGATLLRSAAVHPDRRGAGFGASLVAAALSAAAAEGRDVYLFSTGAGPYWQRFGFVEVPVDELTAALPDAPQVRRFAALGWLPTEVAWKLCSPTSPTPPA